MMPLGTYERIPAKCLAGAQSNARMIASTALCLWALSTGFAQAPEGLPKPGSVSVPARPTQAGDNRPISAQDAPPASLRSASEPPTQLAKVGVRDGKLMVEANNSDLPQILNQVAGISGIAIKGINGGPKVFGIYGPGQARDVLSALLADSGYNFIMVGGTGDGNPREVILTPRNKPAPPLSSANRNADPDADIDDFDPAENAPPVQAPPVPITPIQAQQPPSKDDDSGQKSMERLRVIHEHQQDPPQ